MVTTVPIVSLSRVKRELPIRSGNADFDLRLATFLAVATAQIENHTRRFFTQQVHTEFLNTRRNFSDVVDPFNVSDFPVDDSFQDLGLTRVLRQQTLTLRALPVDLGQTFEIRYDPSFRTFLDATVVAATSYDVDDDNARVFVKFSTRRSLRSLKITYTGGFLSAVDEDGVVSLDASAPEDLKLAAVLQTMFLFKKGDSENVGSKQNKKQGGGATDFAKLSGLTPEAASLLTKYIRVFKGTN